MEGGLNITTSQTFLLAFLVHLDYGTTIYWIRDQSFIIKELYIRTEVLHPPDQPTSSFSSANYVRVHVST
jgi:hypothetical protein